MTGLDDILAGLVPVEAPARPVLTLDAIAPTETAAGLAAWLHEPCRACGGTGRTYPDRERCPCEPAAQTARRLTLARIPWAYRAAGPADLTDRGRAWIAAYERGGRGLRFVGPTGRGKTHRLIATVRGLIERGVSARYVPWSVWLADMRAAMGRDDEMEALRARISVPDVLAIDDLGRERGTEWEHGELDALLERRVLRDATVIVASNLTDAQMETHLGDRLWSRLRHKTDPFVLTGRDWRAP
jgi:hypothetical protein